jgi:hypothetical protein
MLRDRLGQDFPIQFVSDNACVNWELMRPSRGRRAEPLMIDHPVARWIEGFRPLMTNRIPRGRSVTIAPEYRSVRDRLAEAQTEPSDSSITSTHGASSRPSLTQSRI